MIARFPRLWGLMLLSLSCAGQNQEIRKKSPTEMVLARGDTIFKDKLEEQTASQSLKTGFGNTALLKNVRMEFQKSYRLAAPQLDQLGLNLQRQLMVEQQLFLLYQAKAGEAGSVIRALSLPENGDSLLRAELSLSQCTLSDFAYDADELYFVGQCLEPNGVVIGRVSVVEAEIQDDLEIEVLDLKSADRLAVSPRFVFVLDRKGQELLSLRRQDLTTENSRPVPEIQSLTWHQDKLWLGGKNLAETLIWDEDLRSDKNFRSSLSLRSNTKVQPLFGLETLWMLDTNAGLTAFCQADGEPLLSVPSVVKSGIPADESQTQGFALSRGLLVTASQDAGLYFYQLNLGEKRGLCQKRLLDTLGLLEFEKGKGPISASMSPHYLAVQTADQGLLLLSYRFQGQFASGMDPDFAEHLAEPL